MSHKTFGRGCITAQDDGTVTVLFDESKEAKRFVYPAAIGTFLVLENEETAQAHKTLQDGLVREKEKAAADKLKSVHKSAKDHPKQAKTAKKPRVRETYDDYDEE